MFNIKLELPLDISTSSDDLVAACRTSFDEWFAANGGDDSSMATLARISRVLGGVVKVSFTVDGFGDTLVGEADGVELCCALEAIPLILRWAGADEPTGTVQLDFYEQGVERFIAITCDGETVDLACATLTEWRPNPSNERLDRSELVSMLSDIAYRFMDLIARYCPDELANPFLNEWIDDCAPYLASRRSAHTG